MKAKIANKPKINSTLTKKKTSPRVIKANLPSTPENITSAFSFKPNEKNILSSASNEYNNATVKQQVAEIKKLVTTNNPTADRSKNLLNMLDNELDYLKEIQTEDNKRKKYQTYIKHQVEESKQKLSLENVDIRDQSLSINKDKNNYLTLNDLDQKKNDHRNKVEEIEKYFAEKKKLCDYEMSAYSKLTDDYLLANLDDYPKKQKRKESANTSNAKKLDKRNFGSTLSASIQRSKSSTGYDVLNIEEEEFVKKYKDYLAKTHYLQDNFKDNLSDDDKQWDKRGIKSANNRNMKRNIKREETENEYSYYSISLDGSSDDQALSIDISYDKDAVKKKKRQPPTKIKRETKKQFSPFPELNSKLAFFRMIFSVLDKDKNNFVTKSMVRYGLKLDLDILKDLGYLSHNSFFKNLSNFITKTDGILSEEEFLFLLFDRIEFKALFMKYWRTYVNLIEDLNIHVRHTISDDRNLSKSELSTLITKNQTNIILNLNNIEYLTSPDNLLKVTYKDYKSFTDVFKYKTDIKFTIPRPYNFTAVDYDARKRETINNIIEERLAKEDAILNHKFKPNNLNPKMFINDLGLENCIEVEKAKRQHRIEKYKEKVIQEMRPFSFYEDDEKRYKERLIMQCEAPKFVQFRANPVSWTSQIKIYHDIIKKEKLAREQRIKQRSSQLLFASKLPPRMEMHEKEKRERARSEEITKDKKVDIRRFTPIRAKAIPDFERLQVEFETMLENKKQEAKSRPTDFKPFNFHEPKKDVKLRKYLDRENNPMLKNPKIRRNIAEIIQRIERKPKIEPSTTKSLSILMAARRKDMEDKEKKENEKLIEDLMRKEKQNKLKDRVVNSKFIVDNKNALEEKRSKQQQDFKNNLEEQKNKYEQELARRLERVYNKPLMFEKTTQKPDKFTLAKNMQDKLNNLLNEEEDGEIEMEGSGEDEKDHFSQGNNKIDTVEEEGVGEEEEENMEENMEEMEMEDEEEENLTDIEYDEISLDSDLQEDLDEFKKVEYYSQLSSCLLIIRDSLSKGNSDIDIAMTESKNPDRKKVFDKIFVMMMENCVKNIKKADIKFALDSENIDKVYYKFSKMIRFDVYSVSDKHTNEIVYTPEESKLLADIQEIYRNQEMSNIADRIKGSVSENEFDKETYVMYGGIAVSAATILVWITSSYLFGNKR